MTTKGHTMTDPTIPEEAAALAVLAAGDDNLED